MKNNKGFTLVEILSTIVLIALLLGLGIPGVMRISKNMKERSYNTKVDLVEQAGILWGQDNKTRLQSDDCDIDGDTSNGSEAKCKKVTIEDLIASDYLEADGMDVNDKYVYTDPKNNGNMTQCQVYIYKKNNRVYAKYNTDCESIIVTPSPTLANQIIENSKNNNSESTKYTEPEELQTKISENINESNEKILSYTEDDYGMSYYYRGNVKDNYVNFANMCWRIVRIAGDNSIKLILEDQDEKCSSSMNGNWNIGAGNYGYTKYQVGELTASDGITTNTEPKSLMNYLKGTTDNNNSMATALKNFQNTFSSNEISKLKSGGWCIGDYGYFQNSSYATGNSYTLLSETEILDKIVNGYGSVYYYESYTRLTGNEEGFQPTLKCNGKIINYWKDDIPMYVGTLTADEVVYAGGKHLKKNISYYLLNNYQIENSLNFWTLSPYYFQAYTQNKDFAFRVYEHGALNYSGINSYESFRPVVSLKSDSVIKSGTGIIDDPYIVE